MFQPLRMPHILSFLFILIFIAERSRRQEDECGTDDLLQVGECIVLAFSIQVKQDYRKCVNQMGRLIQIHRT